MLGTMMARATSDRLPSPQTLCSAYATVQIDTASKTSDKTRLATTNRCLQTGAQRVTAASARGRSRTVEVNVCSADPFLTVLLCLIRVKPSCAVESSVVRITRIYSLIGRLIVH